MSSATFNPADLPARMAGLPSGNGQRRRSGDPNDPDPFDEIPGLAPNMGQDVLPHVVTFQGLLRNVARTYYVSDEAIQHSWDNARFMRNDPGIMECLEQRQRSTALLGWHLEPDDETDPDQAMLVEQVTSILKQTPNFLKYRECLLHALWYGKYGVAHQFRWKQVKGRMRVCLTKWRPVNGDKIVFRYDDGTNQSQFDEDQVGIRVGAGYTAGSQIANRWTVERINKIQATDHGLAYFLEHWERPLLAIHKHMIEDAEYEAPDRAGAIHGVGIRSRLYWLWYQKQETLAWLMEYLERSAFGIEIWTYPAGNKEAYDKTRQAAQERIGLGRNIVLVPRYPDSDVLSSDVRRIEPGMAGADILDRIIREYFGWQIKRYILGQILTSETASTGLGSGVATIHLDTYLQIVRYDATNLGETITTDTVQPIIRYNWPHLADLPIKFVIETESPDIEGKLSAWQKAYEMGLRLKAADVAELIGAQVAKPGEDALQDPQHAQAAATGQAGHLRQSGLVGPDGRPLTPTTADEDAQKLYRILSGAPEPYRALRPGTERIVYDRRGRVKYVERYKAVPDDKKSDHAPGWKTIGDGANVFIGAGGQILAGCPGLEGEDLDDLGEDEEPENRRRREHRQDVAEHHGLKGEDLTRKQVKQLEDHPHPETGKDADGQQRARPVAGRVKFGAREYEVRQDRGMWFFRLDSGSGWTVAGEETAAEIERQLGTAAIPESPQTPARPERPREYSDQELGDRSWQRNANRVTANPELASTRDLIRAQAFLGSIRRHEELKAQRGESYRQEVIDGVQSEADWYQRIIRDREAGAKPEPPTRSEGELLAEEAFRRGANIHSIGKEWGLTLQEMREIRPDVVRRMDELKAEQKPEPSPARKAAMEKQRARHAQEDTPPIDDSEDEDGEDIPFDIPPKEPQGPAGKQPDPIDTEEGQAASQTKINPRTRVGKAILSTAADYEIAPDDLADALEFVWEQRVTSEGPERQKALEAAHKLSGLYQSDVKWLKNHGFDHTSAKRAPARYGDKLAHFDEFAQEMAREYPVLGLGSADDPNADFAAGLWEILDTDRVRTVAMDDPGLLRQAAELVQASRRYDEANVLTGSYEAFRRRGEVERYRRWRTKKRERTQYAKNSIEWNEEDHPRGDDGRFAGKEGKANDTPPAKSPISSSPIEITGKEYGVDWNDRSVRETLIPRIVDELCGKVFVNRATGKEIQVSRRSVKKVFSHMPDVKPAMALAKLPEILESAVWVGDAPNRTPDPHVRLWHYFQADLLLEGIPHVAQVKIREDANGHWFYDHRIVVSQKKEDSPYKPGNPGDRSTSAGKSSTGIIGSEEGEVKRKDREDYQAKPEDHLPGGRADSRPDSDYDPDALANGTQHELEHTNDPDIAREIAKDHLAEDPDYYEKLEFMESASEAEPEDDHVYSLADRLAETVAKAASQTDRNPSEEQKAAGNYRKGKCRLHGLEIAIETPRGAVRSGKNKETGEEWSIELPYHYGYIKRTESEADGDHIDVFLGPHLDSELVFVIDQRRPGDGGFDEHKCMLGWKSAAAAKAAYHDCYQDGWQGFEAITPMTLPQFREWCEQGDAGKRAAK